MSELHISFPQSKNESCITQISDRFHFTVAVANLEEKCVLLSNEGIHYYARASGKKHARAPPSTPDYDIDYQTQIEPTALHVDQIRVKELPKVSEMGVKSMMECLGQQLGFDRYEYDVMQFWLLDVLADCIWKAQDVFQFDDVQQKVLLDWISALLQLIADSNLNLTRTAFRQVFQNILREVFERIANTCDAFPSVQIIPKVVNAFCEKLEKSHDEDDDDENNSDSDSSTDFASFVKCPEFDISEHVNSLKSHNPLGNVFHGHLYKDAVVSETRIPSAGGEESTEESEVLLMEHDEENTTTSSKETEFPVPCFHPVDPVCGCQLSPSKIYCTCVHRYLEPGEDRDTSYYNMFKDPCDDLSENDETECSPPKTHSPPVPDPTPDRSTIADDVLSDVLVGEQSAKNRVEEIRLTDDDDVDDEEKAREKELINEWAYFKLMEQRNKEMNDARVGWIPWQSWLNEHGHLQTTVKGVVSAYLAFKGHRATTHRKKCTTPIRQWNFNLLKAILDFVFNYIYEDFHFTLIKFAFRYPPNLLTQHINKQWSIPKIMKDQFKRPKEEPKPKESVEKEKLEKGRKSESSRITLEKKKVMDQKSAEKIKQSTSKEVKNEKNIITAEERAELERQQLEQLRLEEEKLAAEVQRMYMFPLADAASDSLFMNIFDNWSRVKSVINVDRNESKAKKVDTKGHKKGKKG